MSNRYKFYTLLFQAYWSKYKYILISSSIIGFFIVIYFDSFLPIFSSFGAHKLQIGIIGNYTVNNLPIEIQNKVSKGLTTISSNGNATEALASNWEVNDKGTVYVFHLKRGLKWHDGTDFNAYDIKYKLHGLSFYPIDNYTLRINLKDPYSPLPVLLSKPIFKNKIIGVGDYKIIKISYRNEYISEILLKPSTSNTKSIVYKFYPSKSDLIFAFKMGQINRIEEISDIHELTNFNNIIIEEKVKYDRYIGLFFNLNNDDYKDKEIRQALAYAIDYDPKFERAYSPIPPISWVPTNKIKKYNYDSVTAKNILSKSKIASQSSEIILSTFPNLLPIAQKIIESWSKAGVKVTVKVENYIPSDFQVFLLTQQIPPDPDQYHFWQSTQGSTNISQYKNPKIDKLLEDGRKSTDVNKRIQIYTDFLRYITDEIPVIFLYYPNVYTIYRN